MTSHTHSAQELYELTQSENGWSFFQNQSLKSPFNFDSHLSDFQAADATCFKSAFPFEDSGSTTDVASPALEDFNGIGGGVNERQPDLNNPRVSTPLQNAFSSGQGRHSVAEVGATICSLVADYLKLLSGLNTTTSKTTLLQAGNEAVSAPDPNSSSRILIDSQGRRVNYQFSKAQRVVKSGKKHGKNRGLRSHKGHQGDFKCVHPGCTTEPLSSRRNLLSLQENVHSTPIVLACGARQKYRRDNFVQHRRKCRKCQESSS